jgi:hypothetical protein
VPSVLEHCIAGYVGGGVQSRDHDEGAGENRQHVEPNDQVHKDHGPGQGRPFLHTALQVRWSNVSTHFRFRVDRNGRNVHDSRLLGYEELHTPADILMTLP